MFYRRCLSFLFQHEIAEMHQPIGAKFCMGIGTRPNFIMPVKFQGGSPQRNFKSQKQAKNLAWFRTTSKFGGEYLRNALLRYIRNWTSTFCTVISHALREKKFGELWSTNHRD